MLCDVNKVSRIPTMPLYILASSYPQYTSNHNNMADQSQAAFAQVSLWHVTAGFMISQFTHVAATGRLGTSPPQVG